MRRAVLFAIVVVVGACALLRHTPRAWAFDGYTYAIMAQVDAGIPYARARTEAQRVVRSYTYETTDARRVKIAAWYPPYWRLFSARPLYPYIVGLLWARFGVVSMFIVSGAAYVIVVLLTYLLALRYADAAIAALASLVFGMSYIVLVLATRPLTDELALMFWVGFVIAALRYADRPSAWRLLTVCALAVALNLTRPLVYAPVCCVAPLVFLRPRAGMPLLLITLLAAVPTIAIAAVGRISVPMPSPYVAAAFDAAKTAVKELVFGVLPAMGLAGLCAVPRNVDRAMLFGAALAIVPTILANPIGADMLRVAVAPVLPLAACGGAALLAPVLRYAIAPVRSARERTS